MSEIIIGASASSHANVAMMQEAGIGWLRHGLPFPFADKLGGTLTSAYIRAREQAFQRAEQGFKLMGVSPQHGIGTREPDEQGAFQLVWHAHQPAWMGEPGCLAFVSAYREMCAWLAEDLRDVVQMWQISNELEIPQFAGPLNMRQACDLILEAAKGLRQGSPQAIIGTNTGGSERAYYLYGRLFATPNHGLDYCGVDQYYGTWQSGGPERWDERIPELFALTGLPVLINEWGYSSAGGLQTPQEQATNQPICRYKRWRHAWGAGHTAEEQGRYVALAMDAFYRHRDILLGAFFYRWDDQATCWQCGAPDCPAETAWGMVTQDEQPKPAYHAFKEGVARLQAD